MTVAARRGAPAALLACLALLCACRPRTQLLLVVDTDLAIPDELDQVDVRVATPSGWHQDSTGRPASRAALPLTLWIGDGRAEPGAVSITVTGLHDGAPVVQREVATHLLADESRVLRVALLASCRGVACPTDQTCTEASCAPSDVDPSSLPRWTGGTPPACAPGTADCDGVAANGCEVDLRGSDESCGHCGNACGVGTHCRVGVCDAGPVAVAAGAEHTCAVLSGGAVLCWGQNADGQLGDPGVAASAPAPVLVRALGEGASGVAAGAAHTCAWLRSGAVACWGSNRAGQLGDGTMTERLLPTPVAGLAGVEQVTAGGGHTCARHSDHTVQCWGDNTHGQLGDGTTDSRTAPTPMPVLEALDVEAGDQHTCALLTNDERYVSCWGLNTSQQTADVPDSILTTPSSAVPGVAVVGAVATGAAHTCVARGPSAVVCWGANDAGQLGRGTSSPFEGADNATWSDSVSPRALAAGARHTCALEVSGVVDCWGDNGAGQLGDGTTTARATPTRVQGLTDVQAIAAGGDHTCALQRGQLFCWGSNRAGQLGDGTTTDRSVPTPVRGLQ